MASKQQKSARENAASNALERDPWPVRDKFAQNLFDRLSDDSEPIPIWLVYLISEGKGDEAIFKKVSESAHEYRGGRIEMPPPQREWGMVTHVGMVLEGKIKSNWRVTPELAVATWDLHADQLLSNLKGRISKSVLVTAMGKIKNPFR